MRCGRDPWLLSYWSYFDVLRNVIQCPRINFIKSWKQVKCELYLLHKLVVLHIVSVSRPYVTLLTSKFMSVSQLAPRKIWKIIVDITHQSITWQIWLEDVERKNSINITENSKYKNTLDKLILKETRAVSKWVNWQHCWWFCFSIYLGEVVVGLLDWFFLWTWELWLIVY